MQGKENLCLGYNFFITLFFSINNLIIYEITKTKHQAEILLEIIPFFLFMHISWIDPSYYLLARRVDKDELPQVWISGGKLKKKTLCYRISLSRFGTNRKSTTNKIWFLLGDILTELWVGSCSAANFVPSTNFSLHDYEVQFFLCKQTLWRSYLVWGFSGKTSSVWS